MSTHDLSASDSERRLPGDVDITDAERDELLSAVAEVYSTLGEARLLLSAMKVPRSARVSFDGGSDEAWTLLFERLDNGVVEHPYRRMLSALRAQYPFQPVFRRLIERHLGPPAPPDPVVEPVPVVGPVPVVAPAPAHEPTPALTPVPTVELASAVVPVPAPAPAPVAPPEPVDVIPARATVALTVEDGSGQLHSDLEVARGSRIGDLAVWALSCWPIAPGEDRTGRRVERVLPDGRCEELDPSATVREAGLDDGDLVRVLGTWPALGAGG
ncbi:effector-associated domain EAD1-containing protein [Streptomyces sp. LX-29]|uniref:effector-associated domain EAD1-containing protein n=1 Tax=Streptomyces sp. LX-29 TaxID=2900152 RepID=UPI00240E73AD|nr:effector-associated domain EAD1-containing protein [Streptomyces sp. LX-29]WFB08485.1 effector-associated domain EAD1-containing protein [Streptomyces sp. LX-29]